MFLSNSTNLIPYNFSQNFHDASVTHTFVTTWVHDNSTTSNTYFKHVTSALKKKTQIDEPRNHRYHERSVRYDSCC